MRRRENDGSSRSAKLLGAIDGTTISETPDGTILVSYSLVHQQSGIYQCLIFPDLTCLVYFTDGRRVSMDLIEWLRLRNYGSEERSVSGNETNPYM
jgi:hypothetical protein